MVIVSMNKILWTDFRKMIFWEILNELMADTWASGLEFWKTEELRASGKKFWPGEDNQI